MVLKVEKLVSMIDIVGLLCDCFDESMFIFEVNVEDIYVFIDEGIIVGGMILKIVCCMDFI